MAFFELLRLLVFFAFAASLSVSLGSWALRKRWVNPFGPTAKVLRKTTDPVLDPIESWILKRGGNPQHAELWLLGGTVVGGILVITVAQWVGVQWRAVSGATSAGPRGILRILVYYGGQLVIWSILIRVIASWFGVGRYRTFMRPFYLLTDWVINPLRRVVPPIGHIDITPIIAWFLLQIILGWLMSII